MIAFGLVGFVLLYLTSMFLRSFAGDLPWIPLVLVIMGSISIACLLLSLTGLGMIQYLKFKSAKAAAEQTKPAEDGQ